MDNYVTMFQKVARDYEMASAAGRTSDPRFLTECVELHRAQQAALSNGNFGDPVLIRQQRILEEMLGIGDFYVLYPDGNIIPAHFA